MNLSIFYVNLVLQVVLIILIILFWIKNAKSDYLFFQKLESDKQELIHFVKEILMSCEETQTKSIVLKIQEISSILRAEFGQNASNHQQLTVTQLNSMANLLAQRIDSFGNLLQQFDQQLMHQFDVFRSAAMEQMQIARNEQQSTLKNVSDSLHQKIFHLSNQNDAKLTEIRVTLEKKLQDIETNNASKLDEMRRTVDEKLHDSLEKRLGDSFRIVSERLEQVHRGLGEMQNLAAGVGDLKRVLTNVKTRGMWGEVQLAVLLEQALTAEQYQKGVAIKPATSERVDFAIRLPGQGQKKDGHFDQVWLPIDAKFPREDYDRLIEAQNDGDVILIEEAGKRLENRVKIEAKSIAEKYLYPPFTTDFALMFLPTEGLYAEILRRPGLTDFLQRTYRVSVVGPNNLWALLNSLQMGFRTLAIEKRSSEVWQILGAVKTEFVKFGDVLAKTRSQLETVTRSIDMAERRSRVMKRRLTQVQALPVEETQQVLGEHINEIAD